MHAPCTVLYATGAVLQQMISCSAVTSCTQICCSAADRGVSMPTYTLRCLKLARVVLTCDRV